LRKNRIKQKDVKIKLRKEIEHPTINIIRLNRI